jgi:hypothetical protein
MTLLCITSIELVSSGSVSIPALNNLSKNIVLFQNAQTPGVAQVRSKLEYFYI